MVKIKLYAAVTATDLKSISLAATGTIIRQCHSTSARQRVSFGVPQLPPFTCLTDHDAIWGNAGYHNTIRVYAALEFYDGLLPAPVQ